MNRVALVLALFLALFPPTIGPGAAQEEDGLGVVLTLLDQSPVVTPKTPLRITVRAVNGSAFEYGDLEVKVWVYNPARSRSAYGAGLDSEPPVEPFLVSPFPVEGSLEPGESKDILVEHALPELAARGENALYPLKVQLESGGVAVGVLRSSLVFIEEKPLVPLNVAIIFVLDEGIHIGPDGRFLDDHLERSIAPEGELPAGDLEALVGSLERVPVPSTLVISPMLTEQLQRMADGYRRGETEVPPGAVTSGLAADMLKRLGQLARKPATEVVALPYSAPSVPSLAAANLHGDLAQQVRVGREIVGRALGVDPTRGLFRPPGGLLSADALRALADPDLEVEALLADPEALPPEPGEVLTPSPTARVAAGSGRSLRAVAPDAVVASRLRSLPGDPRLRAHRVLGELTALYFERPSVDRGVAILFPERVRHDEAFLVPFLQSLQPRSLPRGMAWLRAVRATRLLTGSLEDEERRLVPSRFPSYSPEFLADLDETRKAIAQLDSMIAEPTDLPERLRTTVLVSEAREFLRDEPMGRSFLGAVRDRVRREFDKIEAPSPSPITLTSGGGVIPVTIRNEAGYRIRIRVVLDSKFLQFLGGDSREVVLERPAQQFTFPVRAQTTGRFPVTVRLQTPAGRQIAESTIVVRSTAYNLVALGVTLGAALFLAVGWGRRFLPRARG